MRKYLKGYGILLLNLIVGLLCMILPAYLKISGISNYSLILLLFIIVNILYIYFFKLKKEVKIYWSYKKLYFLIHGILAGFIIACAGMLDALLFSLPEPLDISMNFRNISFMSIITTFIIVSWEELWFRGILLNYSNRYISKINISIFVGFLFMIMHIMNPAINLLISGPNLFFAGAMLTIIYFYYQNIWLPIGIHFGNNFLETLIKIKPADENWMINSNLSGTIIIAIIFIIFAYKIWQKNKHKLQSVNN